MNQKFPGASGVLSALLLCFAITPALHGALLPSFRLDDASWAASNIVSVLVTDQAGVFEVAESWKGDLRPGEYITLPEFAPASNVNAIPPCLKEGVSRFGDCGPFVGIPKQAAGSRIIMFLKPGGQPGETNAKTLTKFVPAMWSDPKMSAIWIDGGIGYAFAQFGNPSPQQLLPSFSESELKSRVEKIVATQQELEEAMKTGDGAATAERLKSLLNSPARQFAMDGLRQIGPPATATLRGMLGDPAFARGPGEASEIMDAYVAAGGETVGEDLNARLKEQLQFFRETAPRFRTGTWEQQDPDVRTAVERHFVQTLLPIMGLQRIHYAAAANTATDLRNLLRSLPENDDRRMIDQISDACDKLIQHLSR